MTVYSHSDPIHENPIPEIKSMERTRAGRANRPPAVDRPPVAHPLHY